MRKRAWLGIVAAVAATQALAQMGGSGRRGGREKSSGDRSKGGEDPVQPDMLEVTLHEFYEDLKLAPAQQPAWDSYSNKIRALAGDIARERARGRLASQATVLVRLDQTVDAARDRLTALEDIAQAAKALYAVLTPEQKAMCDPRLANIMAMPASAGVPARK